MSLGPPPVILSFVFLESSRHFLSFVKQRCILSPRSAIIIRLKHFCLFQPSISSSFIGEQREWTDSTATGADIVLDAITESLLQERFKRAMAEAAGEKHPSAETGASTAASRTSNDPRHEDGDEGRPSPS